MKDDVLMLFDRFGGLMVKTTRSKNRLHKVSLHVSDNFKCLQAVTMESSRWHARLGHVNSETMKTMIKTNLVTGILSL